MSPLRRCHPPVVLHSDFPSSVKSIPPALYAAGIRAEVPSEALDTAYLPTQNGVSRRPTDHRSRLTAACAAREESRLEFFAFDASYIEKLRSGDAQTEGHFVKYFSELIRLKLRSRLNSKEAIEDVRQETFMRVLALLRGHNGGLRQPDRLGPFVNSVCNHVLQEHYRSKKRVEATIDDETESTVPGREPNALSQLETKDTQRVVRQILNALPERDRRLIQSVLLDERDKDEICAELGISREYLRVLLHRAKQSFKTFYVDRVGSR
jgi:RNA polymerase sigma-70 factor, ECF subfamily